MATTAYRAGWPAPGPRAWLAITPKAMPAVAPMNSDGREYPAGAADADGQAGGDHLGQGQHDQKPQGVAAGHGLVHDRVADPVHLRHGQQQQTQGDPAHRGSGPFRAVLPDPVADVLGLVQDVLEPQAEQGRDHRQQGDEQIVAGVVQGDPRREAGQERGGAQELAADHVGDHGREHHGEDGLDGERSQDDLDPEEHPGDGGVEGGRDTARRAAGDQDPQPVLRACGSTGPGSRPWPSRSARWGPPGPPSRPPRYTAPRPGP